MSATMGESTVFLRTTRLPVLTIILALTLAACGSGPKLEIPTPGEHRYTSLEPLAIHAVSVEEFIITGSLTRTDGTPEGLILTTHTGGRTWRRLAAEVHDLKRTTFQAVFFSDRLRGWVGGVRVDAQGRARPVVFRTDDAGNHWSAVTLIQDPEAMVSEVHSLAFTSDRQGSVTVTLRDPATRETRETTFMTDDAGRSWTVGAYREKPTVPFRDQTSSMVDRERGFRLRKSQYPGVTLVEATISEGRDWMPVSELSIGALATYY
ncbi:MAG: hypothetical protein VX913_14240 [Planctomycetota bacterium]|nr:hypothetical protein [Planctomycetota bacterium]